MGVRYVNFEEALYTPYSSTLISARLEAKTEDERGLEEGH